ncbi:MAG: TPM domain-containing protein [Parcubacteria group bacterium]|nr:TPM domain-containing protein [Parcubacteria group bacterium]
MRLWLATILLALPLSAAAYVSPGAPTGFVNDFAGVLSSEERASLEQLLSEYQKQTGNEIAAAIVNSVGDETIETYAAALFQEWGIGAEGRDNGALFVVAVADREMRIEVGYGLEGDLTDVEAKHLVSTVIPPYFASSDFGGGVRAGVIGMLQAVGADASVGAAVAQSQGGTGSFIGEFFWVFIFIFIWLASVFARSRSWWLGGVVGAAGGMIAGFATGGWWWLPILIAAGLGLDYLVSTKYRSLFLHKDGSTKHHSLFPWIFFMGGGPHRWDKGGGFGGFGGGLSGGGGASGRW